MKAMLPIDATIGNENARLGNCQLYLYWLPFKGDNQPRPEIGMDNAIRTIPHLRREFSKQVAGTVGKSHAEGGVWAENRYMVGEGTCLKIWGDRTPFGQAQGQAALVLLCSEDAPLTVVRMRTMALPTSGKNEVVVQGRFWALNRDEVEEFGDRIPALTHQCKHYASPVFVREVFEIVEAAPAADKPMAQIAIKETVATDSPTRVGERLTDGEITISTNKGRRRLG